MRHRRHCISMKFLLSTFLNFRRDIMTPQYQQALRKILPLTKKKRAKSVTLVSDERPDLLASYIPQTAKMHGLP